MTPETPLTAVRQALAGDRRRLRAAVEVVPEARRNERPAEGRWSVAEVLEHLAIVEERSVRALGKLAAEAPLRVPGAPIRSTPLERTILRDRTRLVAAPDPILPSGALTAEEAWSKLAQTRAALEAALDAAEDRDFSQVRRVHPALGVLDGYQWIAAIGGHEERHAEQIKEIAKQFSSAIAQ